MNQKELLEKGLARHQRGDFAEAARLYSTILESDPDHFDALHLLGIAVLQSGEAERGVAYFRRAIAIDGAFAPAHSNLGNALQELGHFEEALAAYDRAIALEPDQDDLECQRGGLLAALLRPEDAIRAFDRAIALNSGNAEAHLNRGVTLRRLGKPDMALACFEQAVTINPHLAEAHNSRGNALTDLNRYQEALASFDQALLLNPDYADVHNNKGAALKRLNRFKEALACYDSALALAPSSEEAHNNRGNVLVELDRLEEAIKGFDAAIALSPNLARTHNNRAIALIQFGRLEDAIESLETALGLNPDFADAYNNQGLALARLNRLDESLTSFNKAIALRADFADAHFNQSFTHLVMGQFEQGLEGYEWRKRKSKPIAAKTFEAPSLQSGDNIDGKIVFVHWEQGFGDTILFCRYARMLETKGATVLLSVQTPLRHLLESLSPTIRILGENETPLRFDYHCPLLSLLYVFGTTHDTIPPEPNYISAPPSQVETWRHRLRQNTQPTIGLAWSGSTHRRSNHNRAIGLEDLIPLLGENANWISLQKEVRESDQAILSNDSQIQHFGNQLADFSDTAALIDSLDLIITIDTAVAHLAAAMGKPTWIILPFHPDWRWLLGRDDSPWYPSVTLFRQQTPGEWAEIVDQVGTVLPGYLASLRNRK